MMRLRRFTGWSAPLIHTNHQRQFFSVAFQLLYVILQWTLRKKDAKFDIREIWYNSYRIVICAVSSKHLQCVCRHTKSYPAGDRFLYQTTRDVFNNASARSAFKCFLSERKCLPRCLQVLAIQVDRCIARKSKMPTKTIMGYREGLCTQYFQIRFSEWRCMLLVWVYEMEQFKLKVERCFHFDLQPIGVLICLLLGAAIFYWANARYRSAM